MKHAEIKQHILNTTAQLFYKQGYNATGINEIITTAGIAKATLYNHFGSKEALCLAYLEFKNGVFLRHMESFCKVRPSGAEQIMAIFDYLKTLYKQHDFNGSWCANIAAEVPGENEVIRNKVKSEQKMVIAYNKKMLTENFPLLDKENATILARKIYLLFESAFVESNVHKSLWPIEDAKTMCWTFFV